VPARQQNILRFAPQGCGVIGHFASVGLCALDWRHGAISDAGRVGELASRLPERSRPELNASFTLCSTDQPLKHRMVAVHLLRFI
jgi:hypothetical protein